MSETDTADAEELARLRAENAGLNAEIAELRRQLDGKDGTIDAMRFFLNGGKLPATERAPSSRQHPLLHRATAGQA